MSDEIKNTGVPVKMEIDNRVLAVAIVEMARNPVVAGIAAGLVPEILSVWAGDSSIKKTMAGLVSGTIVKRLKAVSAGSAPSAWDDPAFVKRFADGIPALSGEVSRVMAGTLETFAKLPPAERKHLIQNHRHQR